MPAKKKQKPSTKKATRAKPSTKQPAPKYAELEGEPYDLTKPGEPRRRHGEHGAPLPQKLSVDQKYSVIDALLAKLTAGVSCDELHKLSQHVMKWAAELHAVHNFEVDDDQIHQAKLIFPTDPMLRLITGMADFQERTDAETDDIVDLILHRLQRPVDHLALTN